MNFPLSHVNNFAFGHVTHVTDLSRIGVYIYIRDVLIDDDVAKTCHIGIQLTGDVLCSSIFEKLFLYIALIIIIQSIDFSFLSFESNVAYDL